MYRYENILKIYDEKGYPYSMEFIKESRYDHFHGNCDEKGFSLVAVGTKHLIRLKVQLLPYIFLKLTVKNTSVLDKTEYKNVCIGAKDVRLDFSVFGRITFSDVVKKSKDKISKTKVFERKFTFPAENGGLITYTITLDVFSYYGIYEMAYTFEGGI